MRIHLKPKKSKIESIIFTSNKNTNGDLKVYELRNFDMSINPTN